MSPHTPPPQGIGAAGLPCRGDAEHSIEQGRPLVVLGGTGRTADAIAAAADPRAAEIAASDLTTVVPVAEPGEMDKAVDAVLGGAVHA